MNAQPYKSATSTNHGESSDGAREVIAGFLAKSVDAHANLEAFGSQAAEAALRLARACYGRKNGQALTVAAALASVYDGAGARPIRLDEIRCLDWELQRDLLIVAIGTGHGSFEDHHIRDAFFKVGGAQAVDWFHWRTCGGPYRAALERLVEAVPHTKVLHEILLSVAAGKDVNLSCLKWLDTELSRDLVVVLDGLIGRNRGHLQFEEITAALKTVDCASALPKSKRGHRANSQAAMPSDAMLPAPPVQIP